MMRFVWLLALAAASVAAWGASLSGWGLPAQAERVSIREGSNTRAGTHSHIPYFLATAGRRHAGGGFRGGK